MELIENLEVLKKGDLIKLGQDLCEVCYNADVLNVLMKSPIRINQSVHIIIEKKDSKLKRKLRKKGKAFSTNPQYIIFRLTAKEKHEILCNEIFAGLEDKNTKEYY